MRPPYFALENLELRVGELLATAVAELPVAGEKGPMTGAELGRHAAIAGLCRAALEQSDDRRRYYLAQRAECHFERSEAPPGTEVLLRVELLQLDKRQARTRVAAECMGKPLALLDISYTILTDAAFARLFAARRQETATGVPAFQPVLAGETVRNASSAQFKVPRVPVEACAGHFDDFPVLPVAVLMGKLAELAGLVLGAPSVPYRVSRGSVSAKDLCWAYEALIFAVELKSSDDSLSRFSCTAAADGRIVGSMDLTLATE